MSKFAGEEAALQLQDLIIDTGNVEDFLDRLAEMSAATLSGSAGSVIECGVTLQRRKRTTTVAGSSPRAIALDQIEQAMGEGPCLEALRTKTILLVSDVDTDPRWPAYLQELAAQGCHSTLGIPLEIGPDAAAALNFFAVEKGVFTRKIVEEAAGFADLAGRALRLAVRIGTHQGRAEDLKAAMEHRTSIDLACGVIMAQNRCTQEEAMAILARVSSTRNQKLRIVAAELLSNMQGGEVRTHFEP